MTDDGNMMDVEQGLHGLDMAIDILESCRGFEPSYLRRLKQSTIRIHNLIKKLENPHRT